MTAALIQSPDRVILQNISWHTYQSLVSDNEAAVRDVEQIDLSQFPPPDLAVEVDITPSSLNRFDIYTDLGIPEIWHFGGQALAVYHLTQGKYAVNASSLAFPLLRASDITTFLELRFPKQTAQTAVGENGVIKQFRQWLGNQPIN